MARNDALARTGDNGDRIRRRVPGESALRGPVSSGPCRPAPVSSGPARGHGQSRSMIVALPFRRPRTWSAVVAAARGFKR